MWKLAGTWTVAWIGLTSVAAAQPTLELQAVLDSVEAHHPRIAASVARHAGAQGEAFAALGDFDPRLRGSATAREGDGRDRRKLDVEIFQPTPAWGTELYAGYRLGQSVDADDWPSYDPDQTLPGGEVRAGLRIPFWRGGPTDERRTRLQAARDRERAAQQEVAATRLSLRLNAMDAYWSWVAAGQAMQASQELLELAEVRGDQLERALAAGAVPAIDVVDNQRMRFERQERLVAARRALQRAAFNLGLYYRAKHGRPRPPDTSRLPDTIEPPSEKPLEVEALRMRVAECHPEIRELQAAIEALEAELRLSSNRVAPQVYGKLEVSRDLGDRTQKPSLAGTAMEAGVSLSMPLALRPERGARKVARAKLKEKEAQLQWLVEQTRMEIADLASEVRTANQRYQAAVGYADAAQTMAEGERTRFQAGASNLLFVNLREQTALDAQLRLIEAALKARLARARWQALQTVAC